MSLAMIFLYSLSITVGVIFVVYGFVKHPYRKELASGSHIGGFSKTVSLPTDGAIALQFAYEMSGCSAQDKGDPTSIGRGKSRPSLIGVLKSPFGMFHREKGSVDTSGLERPVVDGIDLEPKAPKGTPVSGIN